MQILGLLGMYFDAVVKEVEKYLLFFQIVSGHTVVKLTMMEASCLILGKFGVSNDSIGMLYGSHITFRTSLQNLRHSGIRNLRFETP